jgi:hypothetical protein
MTAKRRTKLESVDAILRPDEKVLSEDRALFLNPGGGLRKREAEGYLVLTESRLIFGTVRHGILVDLAIAQIERPSTTAYRFTMSHLTVASVDELERIFVMTHRRAQAVSDAMNKMGDH